MIQFTTDSLDEIPILPSLETETLSHPSMENKVIVIRCSDERAVLMEAFKLITMQQRIIDSGMAKIIYMNDRPEKHAA